MKDYKEFMFSELLGKTISNIIVGKFSEYIEFHIEDGEKYRLIYHKDCCASCDIEDICGDLDDLIDNPVLVAEEAFNIDKGAIENWHESYTWTFYKLDTCKGGVTIRWYGSSNGYYSEKATFEKFVAGKWIHYEFTEIPI